MSVASQQTSTSQASNQTGCVVDPLDLLDFTDYDSMPDGLPSYESPSLSPSSSKAQFTARPPATVTPPTTLPPSTMAGPSHQYDQYKQQTPFVPGALASTMAVNQNNIAGYDVNYMPPEMTSPEDLFDFNTAGPTQNSMSSPEMDMDFEPSADAGFFFESTVNPTAIGTREVPTPVATSNVGRMYPGMHQQAALAKARAAQQQQQQQIIQQQQRQHQQHQQQHQQQVVKHQRTKSNQPSDPIVEQKITQLLNSMRAQSAGSDGSGNSPLHNLPRTKKDEEDMDDDERLLNSEEGKKLSSKERRQLRNKVSARAFRSRRKEYISQLESEIASKVSENGDLRSQNRALMDENRRLSDLTRMLLSSSSFSNFLEHLSTNPAAPTPAQATQRAEQRREESRQAPKDINPYVAAQQTQAPTNMVMVPEQTMEFSMLNINNSNEAAFNYQPQVFSVVETPEMPEIDIAALSGKGSDSLSFDSEQGKVEIPVAEAPVFLESAKPEMPETSAPAPSSQTTVADLDADIFDDETVAPAKPENLESVDLFGGVQSEKTFARYVLVDASVEEAVSNNAMMRVQRITASIEATMNRLERLTAGL